MRFPFIDERFRYVGVSYLRKVNADELRKLNRVVVLQDGYEPIAMLVPYDMFLKMQKLIAPLDSQLSAARAKQQGMGREG